MVRDIHGIIEAGRVGHARGAGSRGVGRDRPVERQIYVLLSGAGINLAGVHLIDRVAYRQVWLVVSLVSRLGNSSKFVFVSI